MRLSSLRASLLGAIALVFSAACSPAPADSSTLEPSRGGSSGGGSGGSNGANGAAGGSNGGSTGSSGGGGVTGGGSPGAPGGGVTPGTDGGVVAGPPPSQPPTPGGFQLTIAPLLDAQGCTECHHHGRPIDMTTYPFMAGTPQATAQSLVTSLTTKMPPAPRTAVAQTVIDQVNAWVTAGIKP